MANIERIEKMVEQFSSPEARFARKAINYYDGNQVKEIESFLSSSESFRKHWREKGLIPRTRNITKAIVDKSGLLFNGPEPVLEVWQGDSINVSATDTLKSVMDEANWIEFFTNFDNQLRLLKSGIVLVQRNPETGGLIFDALHRGNSIVLLDSNTREIVELIVYTSQGVDGDTYRHFTKELITDYEYDPSLKSLIVQGEFPNPYGIIPATAFYDTQTPRYGVWNIIPRDLVGLNEMYNLHLMDSEYSAAWAKVKTLFTNAEIDGSSERTETYVNVETGMPYQGPSSSAAVGGPGRVVQVDALGGNVYLEYKGPDVNLEPIESIFSSWVKDFAGDWHVRLEIAGQAGASSGFQLIVEEMPNLELRKQRQKMFNAGFNRLYQVISVVADNLPFDAMLYSVFQAPALPVDDKQQEEVWSRRIEEGRASRVDYFMEVKGFSRDEALQKVAEIDALNAAQPSAPTRNTVVRVT